MVKAPSRLGFLGGLFTPQEGMALAFLMAVGLFGMGIQLWRVGHPSEASAFRARAEVCVNRASVPELAALPGIGPVLAERILRDRKLHGRFLTLNDLARVKGMTPKTLEKIKSLVRFD